MEQPENHISDCMRDFLKQRQQPYLDWEYIQKLDIQVVEIMKNK